MVSLVGAEEEVSRIRPKLQLDCLCFYLFFFSYIRIPLKILFEESTH